MLLAGGGRGPWASLPKPENNMVCGNWGGGFLFLSVFDALLAYLLAVVWFRKRNRPLLPPPLLLGIKRSLPFLSP